MDPLKMYFLLNMGICYVSLPEGSIPIIYFEGYCLSQTHIPKHPGALTDMFDFSAQMGEVKTGRNSSRQTRQIHSNTMEQEILSNHQTIGLSLMVDSLDVGPC